MKFGFAILLFFFASAACGQKTELYFDWEWKACEANTARYFAVVEKQDSVWHRREYFIHAKRLQMDGFYADAACTIGHGPFSYYYANGSLESKGTYSTGKRSGVWMRYHPNGMLKDSANYINGQAVGLRLGFYANGYPSDSAFYNNDGSGMLVSWFDNGTPSAAGRFAAGRSLQGKWLYFHQSGKPSAVEMYDNGSLVSGKYFAEDGRAQSGVSATDTDAEFGGGNGAWLKYLRKNVYFPSQYTIANADKAVVVVSWVVNEDGSISDVEATAPLHPGFDKIAIEAIRKSPKWKPAYSHNRAVKAYLRQPISFVE